MADISVNGSSVGSALMELLVAADIEPGDDVSYQLCKTILMYHPLGQRMAEGPIAMAQSQKRNITVPHSPESRVVEAFEREWDAIGADKHIRNVAKLARVYGIAAVGFGVESKNSDSVIQPDEYADPGMFISVFDPLNTAGSLVLNQDPNAPDFQKYRDIAVNGVQWHRSRTCVIMNEEPVYIAYTPAAFGFVGRSVYQRALYPLKSFIQTMITDDLVSKKAGLLVAKMKPAGSIVDKMMQGFAAIKRQMLQDGTTGNVLSITPDEAIETLNMMNIDGAGGWARENIIKNIATSADMPAALLTQDTLTKGFGEGTEDAKNIGRYIDGLREWMKPLYDYFDRIVQYRAWNEDFYATIQREYPEEYGKVSYAQALTEWQNDFRAEWPSWLIEPESERVKTDKVKLEAVVSVAETLIGQLDPENKATLIDWVAQSLNDNKMLFKTPLVIDTEALKEYVPPVPVISEGEDQPKPKKLPSLGGDE